MVTSGRISTFFAYNHCKIRLHAVAGICGRDRPFEFEQKERLWGKLWRRYASVLRVLIISEQLCPRPRRAHADLI
jgi:hypothetical protein